MYTSRNSYSVVIPLLIIWGLLAAGCTHKRLKELGKADEDLSREQIIARKRLEEAQALFDKGDSTAAQAKYLEALKGDPGLYKAHLGLGDIYELEGDRLSARVEYVAHTEVAPKPKFYLDRMFAYVFAKFSRRPSDPLEAKLNRRDDALAVMSEAVAAYRKGKIDVALTKLEAVQKGLPWEGLAEYFEGSIHLQRGNQNEALEDLARSVGHNAYWARCLLNDRVDKKLPGLLEQIAQVLERELKEHPSDSESSFILAAVYLRLGRPKDAVRVCRGALSWGEPRWEILLTKAAAHKKLTEKIPMQQAFADLKAAQPNLSGVFTSYEPSVFKGVFADMITDMARDLLAPQLKEPARSYFVWRLLSERGEQDSEPYREAFLETMHSSFPPEEFKDLPNTNKPEKTPAGISEFMGMTQERISNAMPVFQRCDASRRKMRSRPSGRMMVGVHLDREGKVAQVAVVENTTLDDWLSYCVVRKLIPMRFPAPLRAYESFKLPIFFGPEVDGLHEKKNEAGGKPDGQD